MSENRVKHVRHYSVRKREAREFHGSGLISNLVNFARDVEVSTMPQQRPEKSIMKSRNREPNIALYGCFFRQICRPVLLRAIKNKVFLAKSANSQKSRHTMTV